MSDLIYNISKEAAAQILWISTRTVDRYISNNKLSTKKIGNKVMLAQEEITRLKSDFDKDGKGNKVDVISQDNFVTVADFKVNNPSWWWQVVWSSDNNVLELLNKSMDEKFDKFWSALDEKDKILDAKDKLLEERAKMVNALQNRVIELETRIKTMIALPDYNNEKAQMIAEKQTLESQIDLLSKDLKVRKTENNIYMILFAIIWLLLIYFIIIGR